MVDGLGVVPQSLLGKALWVAAFESTLRPGIPIRVKCHSVDFEPLAALFKLGGPVARPHRAKIRKQRTLTRATPQYFRHVLTEADQRRPNIASPRLELFATVADRPLVPVNVLGCKACCVGLRRSSVPKQLVEISALGIG